MVDVSAKAATRRSATAQGRIRMQAETWKLIEQGNISQIKEAIEKSLAPGSQTFERALLQLIKDGLITQEEGLANADSANNLLWLLNNDIALTQKEEAKPEPETSLEATFTEFNLNM